MKLKCTYADPKGPGDATYDISYIAAGWAFAALASSVPTAR
jgi:hypothetical protein